TNGPIVGSCTRSRRHVLFQQCKHFTMRMPSLEFERWAAVLGPGWKPRLGSRGSRAELKGKSTCTLERATTSKSCIGRSGARAPMETTVWKFQLMLCGQVMSMECRPTKSRSSRPSSEAEISCRLPSQIMKSQQHVRESYKTLSEWR